MAAEYADQEATGIPVVVDALNKPLAADGVRVEEEGGRETQVLLHLLPGDESREFERGLSQTECLHALGDGRLRGAVQSDNMNGQLGGIEKVTF